jgi:hypothetical protein
VRDLSTATTSSSADFDFGDISVFIGVGLHFRLGVRSGVANRMGPELIGLIVGTFLITVRGLDGSTKLFLI